MHQGTAELSMMTLVEIGTCLTLPALQLLDQVWWQEWLTLLVMSEEWDGEQL
jgi:hypothetical protein